MTIMRESELVVEKRDSGLIFHPLESDVLCGKNKVCIDHPGSKVFRCVIEQYAQRYLEADSKFEKMNITKEIYDELSQDSRRFLKYNNKLKGWQELSSSQVRDKVGHSLRFRNKQRHSAATSNCSATTSMSQGAIRQHIRSVSETDSSVLSQAHSRSNSCSATITVPSMASPSESPMPSSPTSQREALSLNGWRPQTTSITTNSSNGIPRVSPPAPSKTMHILNAAQANFGPQIPFSNAAPSNSIFNGTAFATSTTTTTPDLSASAPALVFSEWDRKDTTATPSNWSSKTGSVTLASESDVIDIMQEPLMEFEPQSFPLAGNSDDFFLG